MQLWSCNAGWNFFIKYQSLRGVLLHRIMKSFLKTKLFPNNFVILFFIPIFGDKILIVLSAVNTSPYNCDSIYVIILSCLQVIKNPVSDHLPLGCKKYGTSFHVEKVTNPRDIVPEKEPVVVVIGALSHGSVSHSKFRAGFVFFLGGGYSYLFHNFLFFLHVRI